MPREQLRALAADVDRLLVAGAGSVPGDEGLRRREQALRDLGKQVPALAKVAEVVGRAVAADIAGAPRALLDLLLVVGRVRAGSATAGVEGPLGPAGPSGPWATPGPAPDLYPIAAVLTRKGSGRIEALKEAASRGDLGDLRLVDALLAGLDDPSPEFADAVAAEALPTLGPAALPDLRRGLDLRGKAADARRLTALAAIDPGAGLDLCRRAIAEGSAAIKVRALEVLAAADPEEGATIALGLLAPLATADSPAADPDTPPAKGKRPAGSAPRVRLDKKVRDAAMACLGRSCRDEALEVAMAALLEINGAEVYGHRAAHQILATIPHAQATPRLLHELGRMVVEARAVRADASRGEKQVAAKAAGAVEDPAGCLFSILGDRGDRRAAPALIDLLAHPAADLRDGAAGALVKIGDPAGLEAAAGLIGDAKAWKIGIAAAWRLPPGPRFERLAPCCRDLSGLTNQGWSRGHEVLWKFVQESPDAPRRPDGPCRTDWDPRWAGVLRPHRDGPEGQRVAIALEVVLGAAAIPDLIHALGVPHDGTYDGSVIVAALGRHRCREAVAPLVEHLSGDIGQIFYVGDALKAINDPAAIPALEGILAKERNGWVVSEIGALIRELRRLPTP